MKSYLHGIFATAIEKIMHCAWIPGNLEADEVELLPAEAHHLLHVLRAVPGTEIQYTNGAGITGTAQCIRIHKKNCVVAIRSRNIHTPPQRQVHIALALLHQASRMEFAMEKLTELGVSVITPLITAHTERRNINMEKLLSPVVAAAKQSARPFIPYVQNPAHFLQWIHTEGLPARRFIAWCGASDLPLLEHMDIDNEHVLIAIGPEGDFSPAEADSAIQCGFTAVSLGTHVLRAETAAIKSAILLQ